MTTLKLPMKSDVEMQPVFQFGYNDYARGIPLERNPYVIDSQHRGYWERGWLHAKEIWE